MTSWTIDSFIRLCVNSAEFSKKELIEAYSSFAVQWPKHEVESQWNIRHNAISSMSKQQEILLKNTQSYPKTISVTSLESTGKSLEGCAILLTAGGEGERLRKSLEKDTVYASKLSNFTKATFPLPNFQKDFGTLQINCILLKHLCLKHCIEIPVIISTGPKNSKTASIIPKKLMDYNNFGIKNLLVQEQDERIHFTDDAKIALHKSDDGTIKPVTNPDETGGPIMMLKKPHPYHKNTTILDHLISIGCKKLLILQATALYDPSLIFSLATAAKNHDGVGVGLIRTKFPADDPYGTFLLLQNNTANKLVIIEQAVRNNITRELKDQTGEFYLPFNTGFYAIDLELIKKYNLPDYATPPKEILPTIPRSPKIGYAATDLISLAKQPIVLTTPPESFAVLKNADDLLNLSKLGKRFGLDKLFRERFVE